MKKFLSKPFRWAIIFSILLTISFTYVLLDTFAIEKAYAVVSSEASSAAATAATITAASSAAQSDAVVSDSSYADDHIKITIETVRKYDTTYYVADIQVTDAAYLKTAFADSTYGRNIKETTSTIAEANSAILAINGDYYGFRNNGYVLRNGTLYRDTADGNTEDLVIGDDGNFSIIDESTVSTDSLDTGNIAQILSFGPALIKDGQIAVNSSSEVSQSRSSNPRTAIGEISALHYVIVVSDGRTSESAGLSLLDLAQIFADKGCTTAYNLDGGGSSTMYFNGRIVNNPTDGRGTGEREVSDIVYIGY